MSRNYKRPLFGYIVLLLLLLLFIKTGLLGFTVVFLFLYLLTDLVLSFKHRFLRFFPSSLLLLFIYLAVFMGITVFLVDVIPRIIPDMVEYSKLLSNKAHELLAMLSQRYNLPIDITVVRDHLLGSADYSIKSLMKMGNHFTKGLIYFIFALVLSFLLIHEQKHIDEVFLRRKESLLSYLYIFVKGYLHRFYIFFKQVMLGQVAISLINTLITAVVILSLDLPYKVALVVAVFTFGLIPVFGNLISNSILALTALINNGPIIALFCLGYLVIIHKLEYFLNSKIIGSIIRFPIFLTLMTLIVGEALFGIAGFILAVPALLTILYELEQYPQAKK